MRELQLTNGLVTIVDDDLEWDDRYQLAAVKRLYTHYAIFRPWDPLTKTGHTAYLHRFIMSAPQGTTVDHVNGDGLDNRKANLRFATRSQQLANTRIHSHCTSGYRGVCWDKTRGLWIAKVGYRGKQINVGRYPTPEEAFAARDTVARKLFGEFYRDRPLVAGSCEDVRR
jgi:hypothetical protein